VLTGRLFDSEDERPTRSRRKVTAVVYVTDRRLVRD